ncbi:MAG: redox-sensing transcriptional repressor Rex [Fibrobacteres bacterium]|nr:redox-sensing transcriptional repressor Rex [Fibrobacterota bacterium]
MDGQDLKGSTVLSIKRLSRYLTHLRFLRKTGTKEGFSASQLGRDLCIHETQVRKDLALTGLEGRPKTGHSIEEAIEAIEKYFNIGDTSEAFLVGVGHLGTAILGYHSRKNSHPSGIKIVAAFDNDDSKIGKTIHGIKVLAIDKITDLSNRMHISIGIICTPPEAAQGIADMLVEGGVKAIWNFSPVGLTLPESIVLENSDIEQGAAFLKRRLTEQKRGKK